MADVNTSPVDVVDVVEVTEETAQQSSAQKAAWLRKLADLIDLGATRVTQPTNSDWLEASSSGLIYACALGAATIGAVLDSDPQADLVDVCGDGMSEYACLDQLEEVTDIPARDFEFPVQQTYSPWDEEDTEGGPYIRQYDLGTYLTDMMNFVYRDEGEYVFAKVSAQCRADADAIERDPGYARNFGD